MIVTALFHLFHSVSYGFNALGFSAIDDKDVSIGESLQSVEQLNDCDNGTVAFSNFGLFFDFQISYG